MEKKERFNNTKYKSFGEWIEKLIQNDEYIKNIVLRYIKNIPLDIKISNAIDVLDKKIKKIIKYQVEKYLKYGIQEKKPSVLTYVDLKESNVTYAGRYVFVSFLKCLTALGQKDKKLVWEDCPSNFLIFYRYDNLSTDVVKNIFNRFKSLSHYVDMIDYDRNEVNLYYGIKNNGVFEYGILYDIYEENGNDKKIGMFKLTKGVLKWFFGLELKSLNDFKKQIAALSFDDIMTLCNIKRDMMAFQVGKYNIPKLVILEDRELIFKYEKNYNNLLNVDVKNEDKNEIMNIKNNFLNMVLTKVWSSKILFNIKKINNELVIKIKLK